jgi:chromosome segregation ATPase
MTPEEMERVMNFIIERQEQFTNQLAEQQAILSQQQMLVGTLIESQNTLTATVQQIADSHSQRLNRHDERFAETQESINSLTRTVERYINARGSNGSGGNGTGGSDAGF